MRSGVVKLTALLAIGLLIGACGSEGAATDSCATPPADETTTDFLGRCGGDDLSIPAPADPAQAEALVSALDAIAPGLASEPEDTLSNARNTCDSILGGANNLQQATITRFSGDGVDRLTPAQADQIMAVISAEAWCV